MPSKTAKKQGDSTPKVKMNYQNEVSIKPTVAFWGVKIFGFQGLWSFIEASKLQLNMSFEMAAM